MRCVVETHAQLDRMIGAIRSAALAHVGPCDRVLSTDVCDAVDRVIAALSKRSWRQSQGGFTVYLEDHDVLVAGYALPRGHWLRDEFRRLGAGLHSPKRMTH